LAWLSAAAFAEGTAPSRDAGPDSGAKVEAAGEPSTSQPTEPVYILQPEDYTGELWLRSKLTGDWGGLRTELDNKGVQFRVELLQFMQGNAHGGKDTENAIDYFGSTDYILELDTNRMGLWPGGYIKVRGETAFGHGIGDKVGSISPANFDTLFPAPDDCGLTTLTEAWMMQFLSEKLYILAGKVDPSRLPGQNTLASDPYTQFMNTSLWQPPNSFTLVPYTTMTAGVGIMPTDWFSAATLVMDAYGSPTRTGFDTAFHSPNGLTLLQSFSFNLERFTKLPGNQRFNIAWSSRDRYDLDDLGRLALSGAVAPSFSRLNLPTRGLSPWESLPTLRRLVARSLLSRGLRPEPRSDDWAFWYDFDQYLYTEPDDPKQGIGIFGKFGWSPGDTNPVETFYNIGVGGKGIVPTRDRDTFGIGYYHINFNDGLPGLLGIHSEQGIEMYYNIEVTPWLHITPDLQVIVNPGGGFGDRDVAVVYGLRAQMSF
jgi:porin